jgi:uncharacterized protein YcbK (DUF882 family)
MKSKYFNRSEFACSCGCGFDAVDIELLEVLEDIREHFDTPVVINSACRCETHNATVGGKPNSQHRFGKACDIIVKDITNERVQDYVLDKYPNSKGIGTYTSFTHIDVRENKARWRG